MLPISKRFIYEHHTSLINKLIKRYNYKSYLEIGVANPNDNFNHIDIALKEGCDPSDEFPVTYQMTSDEMFEKMPADKKYDIIFIDGMHTEDYVDRDIMNSFKHLNQGGIICLHDTIPLSQRAAKKYDTYQHDEAGWNGDVWKSIIKLNLTGIPFYTIDNGDYGLTLIPHNDFSEIDLASYKVTAKYEDLFTNYDFIFNCLNANGRYALHVIDILDFEKIFDIKE